MKHLLSTDWSDYSQLTNNHTHTLFTAYKQREVSCAFAAILVFYIVIKGQNFT